MSSQQNNRKGQGNTGSNILKTAAVFVGGALAGAALAFFASEAAEEVLHTNQPHRNSTTQPARTQTANGAVDDEKDEKTDGIIQLCEICFLPFEEIKVGGGQIMATPCGHVFCRRCILQSLENRADCPNCRQPVQPSDLQRLYL